MAALYATVTRHQRARDDGFLHPRSQFLQPNALQPANPACHGSPSSCFSPCRSSPVCIFSTSPFRSTSDEAQWTVSARTVLTDPIIWRSTDMQTSGPLNALVISWPVLFGLTPSILTSRLTGLLLQSLTILGMASLIRRGEALSPGTAAVLTTAATLTLAANPDFIHYSSELVSLALIVLFCVVYVRLPTEAPAGPRLALCGLIATCLPFAKMQSALFFLLFHVLCLARLVMDIRARRAVAPELLLYLLASSLPILILVAPLFVVGEQDAFLTGYLGLAAGYGGARTLRIFPDILRLVILMGALTAFLLARYFDPVQRRRCRADLLLLGVALWPTTLLTMWLPGRYFTHYELFGIVCVPLAVIVLQYGLPAKTYLWPSAAVQTIDSVPRRAGGGSPHSPQSGGDIRASLDGRRLCAETRRFTAALRLDRREIR